MRGKATPLAVLAQCSMLTEWRSQVGTFDSEQVTLEFLSNIDHRLSLSSSSISSSTSSSTAALAPLLAGPAPALFGGDAGAPSSSNSSSEPEELSGGAGEPGWSGAGGGSPDWKGAH